MTRRYPVLLSWRWAAPIRAIALPGLVDAVRAPNAGTYFYETAANDPKA